MALIVVGKATPKNDLPPGGHIFITTETIFELIQDIIGTYRLTKFHKDKKINVAWRVLTRFTNSHRWKNAPPTGSYVFRPTGVIFEVVKDIVGMNLLAKFNEDRTIHVAPVVKIAQTLESHDFLANATTFELYLTINVAHRVKNAPPPDIIGANLLTTFPLRVLTSCYFSHIRKNAPSPGGHIFQPTGILFKLVQDIIGMNILTRKNAPPLGSHVFQANVTIFDSIQDIIETNLLTKFHEDWSTNVTSTVNKANVDAARRTKGNHKSSP
ncbi:hypothetical protein DPMN_093748 [Dreissena polymorpha]|uniref:Uncharacterized protein n=1 Tax=Dreissena polymorpha TaxID=45954 RepID=A0A9D4L4R8_DREPO|nr:hypothetical protein DPMN_093748 [Dreissena polymorpha]